jgi:hypothetical protein
MKRILEYIFQWLLLIDQAGNVALGGKADETLSSRAYRAWRANRILGKIFRPLIDTLFFWEKNHCRGAYISEVERKQLPDDFLRWVKK